jgi:hypothetical protein
MAPRSWVVCLFLAGLTFAGCSGPPQALLTEARRALEATKSGGAELYAPEAMGEATAALSAAESEMTAQGSRFILMRNYKVAAAKLNEALVAFQRAAQETATSKGTARTEVRSLVKTVTLKVDEADQMIAKVTATKPDMDLTAWQNELAGARQDLADASEAEKAEDYPAAKSKLLSAESKALALMEKIEPGTGQEPAK